jgi:uridine phosphorylase
MKREPNEMDELPLLNHPLSEPTAFTPEALLAAVRQERGLAIEPPPPVCVLDFDGDLTDSLIAKGRAHPWKPWPCFHTTLLSVNIQGDACGIIARTIGGPYAVLVAEQLAAAGTRVIIGLTSAGRVLATLPIPSLVIATSALRDEGTSFHYLPPGRSIEAPEGIPDFLENELKRLEGPVSRGPVWTTDAPYRETRRQLETHAAAGVLAVEMQAASLFSFARRRKFPVAVVAQVSNAVDHTGDPFDKGSELDSLDLLQAICRAGQQFLECAGPRIDPVPHIGGGIER